jgi:uncharacterized protein
MKRVLGEWILLPQRFAVHEPSATAVLADLHLGYSAARQRLGDAIPIRSVREELQPLADAARIRDVRSLIVAGDLFERGYDDSVAQAFLELLGELAINFVGLVPGNHDRGAAKGILQIIADGHEIGGWRIVHGDQPCAGEKIVMGHWHPAIRRRGRKTPCFLTRGTTLVLPAFSRDAAGVDVDAEARWQGWLKHPIS